MGSSASPPSELPEWQVLAERFRLESSVGWGAMLAIFQYLSAVGRSFPPDLASIHPAELYDVAKNSPCPAAMRTFWAIARSNGSVSSSAEYIAPSHDLFAMDSMAIALRKRSAQYAATGQLRLATRGELRAPRDFARMGPAQRIKMLQSASVAPRVLDRYV